MLFRCRLMFKCPPLCIMFFTHSAFKVLLHNNVPYNNCLLHLLYLTIMCRNRDDLNLQVIFTEQDLLQALFTSGLPDNGLDETGPVSTKLVTSFSTAHLQQGGNILAVCHCVHVDRPADRGVNGYVVLGPWRGVMPRT